MLTNEDIKRTARLTVEILERGGYKCCLFGSAACFVWGLDRTPNDIDMVVFSGTNPEKIKRYVVQKNDQFFLVDAIDPGDTYKKLYFRLDWRHNTRCKIDILLPGQELPLHIPWIPIPHITYVEDSDGIPVMPLFPLLVLKIQGWDHHRDHAKPWMKAKVPQDIEDIEKLMTFVDDSDCIWNHTWLPGWFIDHAFTLIHKYWTERPESATTWRYLGINVELVRSQEDLSTCKCWRMPGAYHTEQADSCMRGTKENNELRRSMHT